MTGKGALFLALSTAASLAAAPLPRHLLPEPVFPGREDLIEVYWAAWEMAWAKVTEGTPENGFAARYMNEGFDPQIFQWDSCFIVAFGMYGRDAFPAMETLDNFYAKQREDGWISRVYRESDGTPSQEPTHADPNLNPPLFAWVEWRWVELTGDTSRIGRVLPPLVRYWRWVQMNSRSPYLPELYWNTGLGSGMDNSPRAPIAQAGWIDMTAQQALAARCIARLAAQIGRWDITYAFEGEHLHLCEVIQQQCWDDERGFFADVTREGAFSPTLTIATLWPLWAGAATAEQSRRVIEEHLTNPDEFWRPHLVPALPANDPRYDPHGHYWLGGVWAPTNYMTVQALNQVDRPELAREIAVNHIENVARVFHSFIPSPEVIAQDNAHFFPQRGHWRTLWENYAPEVIEPGTRWDGRSLSRQDFVGWTGLGPIALLIEEFLGFEVNGLEGTLTWRLRETGAHGIRRLRVGDAMVDVVAEERTEDGTRPRVTVRTDAPFTLVIENPLWGEQRFDLEAGQHDLGL